MNQKTIERANALIKDIKSFHDMLERLASLERLSKEGRSLYISQYSSSRYETLIPPDIIDDILMLLRNHYDNMVLKSQIKLESL